MCVYCRWQCFCQFSSLFFYVYSFLPSLDEWGSISDAKCQFSELFAWDRFLIVNESLHLPIGDNFVIFFWWNVTGAVVWKDFDRRTHLWSGRPFHFLVIRYLHESNWRGLVSRNEFLSAIPWYDEKCLLSRLREILKPDIWLQERNQVNAKNSPYAPCPLLCFRTGNHWNTSLGRSEAKSSDH